MRHGIAAGKCRDELLFVIRAQRMKRGVRQLANGFIPTIRTASNDNDLMTFGGKRPREMSADKSSAASDGNFH
jgi:hypothetical protein